MSHPHSPAGPVGHTGRTRWGRAAVATAVGLAATAALAGTMWRDAFGFDADIVIQDDGASFSSSQIYAHDAGFGMVPVKQGDGRWRNVLRAGFASAEMNGLCVSQVEKIAGMPFTFKLLSGDGDASTRELQARNAAFDITDLRANGTGVELQGSTQIGVATPDITTSPGRAPYDANPLAAPERWDPATSTGSGGENSGRTNGQGWTGIDATVGDLTQVYGTLHQAQVSGDIVLPDLQVTVTPGTSEPCAPEPPTANHSFPK